VFAEMHEDEFSVSGMVGMPDGSQVLRAESRGAPERAEALAAEVAADLLGQGAAEIIAALGK
jgi:hydroxymethylbilane synthase